MCSFVVSICLLIGSIAAASAQTVTFTSSCKYPIYLYNFDGTTIRAVPYNEKRSLSPNSGSLSYSLTTDFDGFFFGSTNALISGNPEPGLTRVKYQVSRSYTKVQVSVVDGYNLDVTVRPNNNNPNQCAVPQCLDLSFVSPPTCMGEAGPAQSCERTADWTPAYLTSVKVEATSGKSINKMALKDADDYTPLVVQKYCQSWTNYDVQFSCPNYS